MAPSKIGIVVPVYNALPHIERCLTTLDAQTYPVQVYVVDDASDDGTLQFLIDRPHLYTKLEHTVERSGWPKTLNQAASAAMLDGCDAIFTMNADDFLRLDCIAECVNKLAEGYDWVVCNAQQIGGENVVQVAREGATLEDLKDSAPLTNYALIPMSVWSAVGGYPTDVSLPGSWGYKEDHAFVISTLIAGLGNYGVVNEPVYYYVMHEGQLHESGVPRHEEAMELIRRKYGL